MCAVEFGVLEAFVITTQLACQRHHACASLLHLQSEGVSVRDLTLEFMASSFSSHLQGC